MFSDTVYITDINELIDTVISYCDSLPSDTQPNLIIFFDEIFTVLEKRTNISKKILSFISQLRKRKIVLVTTAQEWLEIKESIFLLILVRFSRTVKISSKKIIRLG